MVARGVVLGSCDPANALSWLAGRLSSGLCGTGGRRCDPERSVRRVDGRALVPWCWVDQHRCRAAPGGARGDAIEWRLSYWLAPASSSSRAAGWAGAA